jgi:hypothetical protein
MMRPLLLAVLVVLALGGGALAYWKLGPVEPDAGAELPAFDAGEACESCSLRHQRLQRERTWTD